MQFKLLLFIALFAYAACDETEEESTECTSNTPTTQTPDDQMQITCNLCLGSPTSDCAKDTIDSMVTQTCRPIRIHPNHGVHPHPHKHHRHHHHHHFSTTPIPATTETPITITDAGNSLPESTENSAPVAGESLEREERDSEEHENHGHWKKHEKHAHFGKLHGKGHHGKILYPQCIYLRTKGMNVTSALVTRGCGYSPNQKDVCKFIQKLNKDIVECKSCTTDKCN